MHIVAGGKIIPIIKLIIRAIVRGILDIATMFRIERYEVEIFL